MTDATRQETGPDQANPQAEPRDGGLDQALISPAQIGFYGCCVLISVGAGMFFFALLALDNQKYGSLPLTLEIVGGALLGIGLPGAFYCLHRSRQNQ